jgi:hypothetical protein
MWFETGHEHDYGSALGMKYLIDDAGYITAAAHGPAVHQAAIAHQLVASSGTLVHIAGGDLAIRLVWDASVAHAPRRFTHAVVQAARLYVEEFAASNRHVGTEVINISVGYGEVGGSPMGPHALGESESYGYLTNYASVAHALAGRGYSFAAANEPSGGQFFVTTAEEKALGLFAATSPGTDGFIGFSTLAGTGYHWNFASVAGTANSGTGSRAFDFEAVAWHEISEVMGRIGLEGKVVNGLHTYTPLDLFLFKSPGELALSGTGSYFSIDNGSTPLGRYNNANVRGGDVADWASTSGARQSGTWGLIPGYQDAYDAFLFSAVDAQVTASDLAEDAALGYGSLATARAIV